MPITYYGIGALFQFILICMIRFAYRIIVVERRKNSRKKADALVVGGGDEAHYVLRLLNSGLIYRPVAIVDKENTGRMVDGLPVYRSIPAALDSHSVDCVFLASTSVSKEEKEEIHEICGKKNIPLRDYTNFFTYTEENDSFYDAREMIQGPEGEHFISFSPPDIGDSEISDGHAFRLDYHRPENQTA